jgi:hypothetical protein
MGLSFAEERVAAMRENCSLKFECRNFKVAQNFHGGVLHSMLLNHNPSQRFNRVCCCSVYPRQYLFYTLIDERAGRSDVWGIRWQASIVNKHFTLLRVNS